MPIAPILHALFRNKLRFVLITVQLAVTLALFANCVTLVLHARAKMQRPEIFDEDNLIFVAFPILDTALQDHARRDAFFVEAVRGLREIEGVRAVSACSFGLWTGSSISRVKAAGSAADEVYTTAFSADEVFLEASGAELDEGRWFTLQEVLDSVEMQRKFAHDPRARDSDGKYRERIETNVVVSRAFGKHLFGDEPLLGKIIQDENGDMGRIIGVISRFYAPGTWTAKEEWGVAFPGRIHSFEYGFQLLVRTRPGQAVAVASRIKDYQAMRYDLAEQTVRRSMDSKAIFWGPQRMLIGLMGLLVVLLLFVASLCVAGLMSFSITERTRQIGVRRALGATRSDTLRYFLTETGIVTTIGLALGTGLSVPLNMALQRFYDGATLQPIIVAGCVLLLFWVALASALPPALRASRISPAIATRNV